MSSVASPVLLCSCVHSQPCWGVAFASFFGGILIILLFKLLYLLTSSRQNKQIIIEHYQLAGICRKICKYHIIWGARLHCSWIPQPPTSNTSFFLPAGLSYLLATPSLSVCNGVESAELYSGVFKSNGHPSHSAHLSANRLALLLLSGIADQINQTDSSSPSLALVVWMPYGLLWLMAADSLFLMIVRSATIAEFRLPNNVVPFLFIAPYPKTDHHPPYLTDDDGCGTSRPKNKHRDG